MTFRVQARLAVRRLMEDGRMRPREQPDQYRQRTGRCPPGFHVDPDTDRCRPVGEFPSPDPVMAPISGLAHAIRQGQIQGSLEQHRLEAQKFLSQHDAGKEEARSRLEAALRGVEGVRVTARVKDLKSALGKMARNPRDYPRAANLPDGTGMRVVCRSMKDVQDSLDAIRQEYGDAILWEADYIVRPKRGYRSYHLTVRDADGLEKEIQVRTARQDQWAEWAHDAYKPHGRKMARVVDAHRDAIADYGQRVSDYYLARDQGEQVEPPDCPSEIRSTVGCLP